MKFLDRLDLRHRSGEITLALPDFPATTAPTEPDQAAYSATVVVHFPPARATPAK